MCSCAEQSKGFSIILLISSDLLLRAVLHPPLSCSRTQSPSATIVHTEGLTERTQRQTSGGGLHARGDHAVRDLSLGFPHSAHSVETLQTLRTPLQTLRTPLKLWIRAEYKEDVRGTPGASLDEF
jgi:hypothetical protein